jgi:hypothetical protein
LAQITKPLQKSKIACPDCPPGHWPVFGHAFLQEIAPSVSITCIKPQRPLRDPCVILKSRMSIINQAPNDRAAINRENARRSTGPRTPEGKKRASLNAMRHGLTGQTVVSPKDDLSAYLRFTRRFYDDLKPKGAIESQLVQTIADNSWRLNRARVYENNLLTIGFDEHSGSIDVEDPEIHRALATAKAYRAQAQSLSAISMHEQRVSRQFDCALKQLGELQAIRRKLEQQQIEEAARLYQLHNEQQQAATGGAQSNPNEPTTPYHATEDGFVFANEEIETHIRREERRKAARQAELQRGAGISACRRL